MAGQGHPAASEREWPHHLDLPSVLPSSALQLGVRVAMGEALKTGGANAGAVIPIPKRLAQGKDREADVAETKT